MTHPGESPHTSSRLKAISATSTPAHDSTPPYGLPRVDDSSSGGTARGVVSILAGLVLPPVAYVAFDWAFVRYWRDVNQFRDSGDLDPWTYGVLGGAAMLLTLVAAAGRLSPAGPIIAALVYGALPTAAVVLAREEVLRASGRIQDWSFVYADAMTSVPFYGILVFPTVTALLLGTAIAGAGRRR